MHNWKKKNTQSHVNLWNKHHIPIKQISYIGYIEINEINFYLN